MFELELFDMSPNTILLLGGVAVLSACLVVHSMATSSKGASFRLPPSPPTTRLLGHEVPRKNPFLQFAQWIEEYGPLISLRMGTTKYIVIGRYKAAVEIMERQGGSLVDRPRSVAVAELLSGGLGIFSMPPGERLKGMRRALHSHLQPRAVQTYEPLQMLHAKDTVLGILETPHQYEYHARTYAASVVLKITYGKNTPTSAADPDVVLLRKGLKHSREALRPGGYLVDIFPFLKYLPWYGRELRETFTNNYNLFHRQLYGVKHKMNNQDIGPSFAKFLLEHPASFGLDETDMAFIAGAIFGAGSGTTALSICIAMMAAACHPKAQAMVHTELGDVIGTARAPTFDDEKSLPVLRAFILESMRWRPLAPLGLAHRATQDIVWGDYFVPAGTAVYGNHWAISRDPDVFPDPEKFDLTRWLDSDGKLRNDLKFPYFGFGRRVCPGQHLATKSIFINTALILWSFRLKLDSSKPLDDMAFMMDAMPDTPPCSIDFEPRMDREVLRVMMEQYSATV